MTGQSGGLVVFALCAGVACSSGLAHRVQPSEVSSLAGTFAENIDAAKRDVVSAEQSVADANAAMKVAQAQAARAAYQEALLDEREAAVEMAEAELWVKKAKYELVKLEMLITSKGLKDVQTTEKLLEFKRQLSEREQAFLERQRDHSASKAEREETRRSLNQTLRAAGLQEVEDPDAPPPEPVAPPPPASTPPKPAKAPPGAQGAKPAGDTGGPGSD